MTLASIAVDEVLLLLKIAFLVLLYLFIWRVVRTASRDLRAPQESFVLAPQRPKTAQPRRREPSGRLVVVRSPALPDGEERLLDSAPVTLGRSPANDLALEGDEYASSLHARVEPRRDGIWLQDAGSTNGTYVNGVRLEEPRKLVPGDLIRIGETDLRFER
jgi:pSer/pThr/pTyr-binding forkhead associated (FHA) protein